MLELIGQAVVMFAVTNVDDVVLLALFFGRARGDQAAERRVVAGQYLGFGGILAVSVLAAVGLSFLPSAALAYLGLIPLAIGVKAGIDAWRERRVDGEDGGDDHTYDRTYAHTNDHDEGSGGGPLAPGPLGVVRVAGITFANGGDNVGVYVPVFAAAGIGGTLVFAIVFLLLVGALCVLGRAIAGRPTVARILDRWGHVLLPVVLVALGVIILVEGGAFGL